MLQLSRCLTLWIAIAILASTTGCIKVKSTGQQLAVTGAAVADDGSNTDFTFQLSCDLRKSCSVTLLDDEGNVCWKYVIPAKDPGIEFKVLQTDLIATPISDQLVTLKADTGLAGPITRLKAGFDVDASRSANDGNFSTEKADFYIVVSTKESERRFRIVARAISAE